SCAAAPRRRKVLPRAWPGPRLVFSCYKRNTANRACQKIGSVFLRSGKMKNQLIEYGENLL
ncbi:MAG: hypothetical protein ACLSWV_12325, partial [Pygmaiobacter massiliensis]